MGIFQGSWPIPRWLAATLGALSLLMMSAGARAEGESLAGTWAASPMVVSWQLGDWGKQCGPPPSGGVLRQKIQTGIRGECSSGSRSGSGGRAAGGE